MLAATVSLHDVENVESFVHATLDSSRIVFERQERDDLVLEGLAILYDLADSYEPHREGYAQPGRFSGYAARYLPRRLGEAWHRLHPEHIYQTLPDGSRKWAYLPRPISLEGARAKAALGGNPDSVDGRIRAQSQWARPEPA